jgi:hypothetical protein
MFAIGAQTMTRPAAMTFATIVAVVGVTLATPGLGHKWKNGGPHVYR